MLNVMTWIQSDFPYGGSDRYSKEKNIGEKYLKLQVENSLRLGWKPEQIIIGTNFPFEYMRVKAYQLEVTNNWSAFSTKMPSLVQLMEKVALTDNLWVHDCDVYQITPFDFPAIADIAYVRHSIPARNKPQGGVIFIKNSGYDIIKRLAKEITELKVKKEESYMIGYYAQPELVNRRTWLNYTYNLFRQSDFKRKYRLARKPILACHFHSEYTSTYDCFVNGKNCYNVKIVTPELKALFDKYDFKPTIRR